MKRFVGLRQSLSRTALAVGLACQVVGSPAIAQAAAPPTPPSATASGYTVANKILWVVLSTRVDAAKEAAHFKAHMDLQMAREKEGILFAAGPAQQVGGDGRFGLIILRAANEAEARRLADADPMHANGARTYTLYRWMMNEASFDFRVVLSNGTVVFE